jgi:hypothetical protein
VGQLATKACGDWAKEDFLERVLAQVTDVPFPIIVLAIAGNRQIGVDGDVVS